MTTDRWVDLATAPDQVTADIWVSLLHAYGIPAIVRPDVPSYLGMSLFACRVQVRESDREEALSLIENEDGAATN
jgi:hypothetical protein